jgi:hypothetical protein
MIPSLYQADLFSERSHLRAVYQLIDIQDTLDHFAILDEFYEGQLVTELIDRGHATWRNQSHEESYYRRRQAYRRPSQCHREFPMGILSCPHIAF